MATVGVEGLTQFTPACENMLSTSAATWTNHRTTHLSVTSVTVLSYCCCEFDHKLYRWQTRRFSPIL